MQQFILFKIGEFFLDNPHEEIYLRELSKKLDLSPSVIKKYLDLFLKEKFILEQRKANLRYFKANLNNLFYKHIKIAYNINLLLKSGIVDYLKNEIPNVSSIVLFGSLAKGLDDKKSDIDILIIGKNKHVNLNKFEEKLNKEITLHIYNWSDWNKKSKEDSAFYFEVIGYGLTLYGELPLVK